MSRKFLNIVLSSALALVAVGCDFQEINVDPNRTTEIKPGPLLTYSQMQTNWDANTKNMQVGICMMVVQQTATLKTTEVGVGDKYIQMDAPCNQYFIDLYSGALKNLKEMEYIAGKTPEYVKMQGVGKIWSSYLYQRMTDLYGDVPYTEACAGYHSGIYKPVYDKQEDIYNSLIANVQEGMELLDKEGLPIEGDLFFDGDIAKWKKFGNSILLHLGMRLSKVNPSLAKTVASKAIAGGIMTEAADAARIVHYADGRNTIKNPLSYRFFQDNFIQNDAVKISKTFLDYLQATHDPRISVLCSLKDGNNDPAKQKGLSNGYSNESSGSMPGFTKIEDYSNFNTNTIMKMDAPTILMTASETLLLKAEAILRGWASGDAAQAFDEAVKVAMEEQKYFYGVEIPQGQIDSFLGQKLFQKASGTEAKLEVLGCQYWVATFMNGFESFANWRRCGYPKLKAVNYSGNISNGTIPRRLLYSLEEASINAEHLQEAIARQGEDKVTTRVWWDK